MGWGWLKGLVPTATESWRDALPCLRQYPGLFPSGERSSGAPGTGTWGKLLYYTYSPEEEFILIVFSNSNCKKRGFFPFFFFPVFDLPPAHPSLPASLPMLLQLHLNIAPGACVVRVG